MKLKLSFLAVIILLFASCGSLYNLFHDRPENTDKYLEQFRKEAAERGIEVNYPKRLQISLVDYMSGTRVGYCYNDIPMKIDLDRDFWTSADTTQQKILFFHELGHCMLNRKHFNEVLPNGEWKSLMRGSPIPEKRDYVVNFSGFRTNYYLDELFDPETTIPDWATFTKNMRNNLDLIVDEDFGNNDLGWTTMDKPGKFMDISEKSYILQNDADSGYVNTTTKIALSTDKDFMISTKVSLKLDSTKSAGGVFFGETGKLEYFLVDRKFGLRFGNTSGFRPYTNIPVPDSVRLNDLSLTIESSDERLYYFLGDRMVYMNESSGPDSDSLIIGYNLSPHSELVVKGLRVYN